MKLRYSPTSPYVRKVLICAFETGLAGRIETVATDVWDRETDIATVNPLGKIPALVTDEGVILFDSPVICEYLDSLHDGDKLFPPSGLDRWSALRLQALADGVTDAAVLKVCEARRSDAEPSQNWLKRQDRAIFNSLDLLESDLSQIGDQPKIGQIALACALGYLDLRLPENDWRNGRPNLAAWFANFAERPSMVETRAA